MSDVDWSDPYFAPVPIAVELSGFTADHLHALMDNGHIGFIDLRRDVRTPAFAVSMRDVLAWQRDHRMRGQKSVENILLSLRPVTIYYDTDDTYQVVNAPRARGASGRLRNKRKSKNRSKEFADE